MYIVTKNNPYYPSVEYFDTLVEAEAQRDEWVAELEDVGGCYFNQVTIATVLETVQVTVNY